MAFKFASVSVGTTATSLTSGVTDTRPGGEVSRSILIANKGSASVYLGGPTVTSAAGYDLVAGAEVSFDLGSDDEPFAIAASGTVTVHVLHMGV